MTPIKLINSFCTLFMLLCLPPAYALEPGKKALIYLEAEAVDCDYKQGIIHYNGHVKATQGDTLLTADTMTVYYDKDHRISKVVAIGNLASYKTMLNDNKDLIIAFAKTISYLPIAGQVRLEENAKVKYNNNLFTGPDLHYDVKKQMLTSHPNTHSRTKIILEPFKELKTQFDKK